MRPWNRLTDTEQLGLALLVISVVCFMTGQWKVALFGTAFGLFLFVYE